MYVYIRIVVMQDAVAIPELEYRRAKVLFDDQKNKKQQSLVSVILTN